MRKTEVDALLFDLGNVLVEIDFDRVFRAWAEAASVPAAFVESRFKFDGMHQALEISAVDASAYFEHVRRLLGLPLSDEMLAEGWNQVFVREMPGIRDVLSSLGVDTRLYVLSNTDPVHHRYWRARFEDLLQPFREVFVSCELGERKPGTQVFTEVLRRIDLVPERVAFFDDLSDNVLAASKLGMAAFVTKSASDIRRLMAGELRVSR